MKQLTALIAAFCISFLPVRGEAPDYDKKKAAWERFVKEVAEIEEKRRNEDADKKISVLQESIPKDKAELKKLLETAGKKKAQIASDKSKASTVENRIERNAAEVKKLEALKKTPVAADHGLDPRELKEGEFGKLGTNSRTSVPPVFKVLQVQDAENALMTWGKKTYWVQVKTKGLTDGDEVRITDFVHCIGTKSYQGLLGKNTVLEIRIVK